MLKQAGLAEVDETSTDNGSPVPLIIHSFPEAEDVQFTLTRLYTGKTFNCARSLEHNLVMRAVIRNTGSNTANAASATTHDGMDELPPLEAIKFPSPADIYNKVWGAIPDFLKARITQWAKSGNQREIAREITSYVKTALGLLPVPVPKILINAAANLVIPPLVQLIISKLAQSGGKADTGAAVTFRAMHDVTPQTHELTKDIDCSILQSVGISYTDLPAPLSDAWEGPPATVGSLTCLGQPLDRDASLSLKQFYDRDDLNGCKPMALTQVVSAQISVNPASDQATTSFSPKVWSTLTETDKSQLTVYARMSPPSKNQMVPEVIEWIISTH